MKTLLGTGYLSWNAAERRMDRYGFVRLFDPKSEEPVSINGIELEGKSGKLVAEVLVARKSDHVGDLFRSIFPVTPEVGEMIELGRGLFVHEHYGDIHENSEFDNDNVEMQNAMEAFLQNLAGKSRGKIRVTKSGDGSQEEYDQVGLRPEDDRSNDWLDPHKLYRAHFQVVNLWFEETI